MDVFADLEGGHFVTLTLDPKTGLSESLSRKYVQQAWSKWRKRLARLCAKTGAAFRFVRVIEYQASGQAHVHAVLTAEGVAADQMASAWFACGGGVVCDVQPLTGDRDDLARRIGYAVKYALKDATAPNAPRGRHYVETSEGIGYQSAAAVASRAAYTAREHPERKNQGEGLDGTPGRVWRVNAPRPAKPTNPDAITAADLAAFAALDLGKRSQTYRWRDPGGTWWRIRQLDTGERTRHPLAGYRSLYEERVGAADRAARPSMQSRASREPARPG